MLCRNKGIRTYCVGVFCCETDVPVCWNVPDVISDVLQFDCCLVSWDT